MSTPQDEFRDLRDTVIRMEAKLDLAIGQQSKDIEDHEARLRDLESRRLPHSVMNIGAAVGATAALIWQAVSHH